jgi:hypothetical protein
MLDMLRKISGGNRDLYTRNIFGAGLAPSMNMAWEMSGKNLTLENFAVEAKKFRKTGVGGYEKEAEDVFGITEKTTAKLKGFGERTGFVNVEGFGEFVKNISEETNIATTAVKAVVSKVEGAITKWENSIDKQLLKLDEMDLKEEKDSVQRALLISDTIRINKRIRDYLNSLPQ